MDTKLQRITDMMKEVEEKQQRERDFVSVSVTLWDSEIWDLGAITWIQKISVAKPTTLLFSTITLQLLNEATESRRKCDLMKEQETQLKQQVRQNIEGTLLFSVIVLFSIPK